MRRFEDHLSATFGENGGELGESFRGSSVGGMYTEYPCLTI